MKLKKDGLAIYTKGEKKNQAIVFVHGFPFDHTMWDFQVNHLKEEFYCVSYDIRGFGKSKVGDGQFTMEMFANDLINIVEELNLENPILCGLSMGGYISLRAIELVPARFGGLILLDTKAQSDDDFNKIRRSNIINFIDQNGHKPFIKDFISTLFCKQTILEKPKMVDDFIDKYLKNDKKGVKGGQLAMISRTDTTEFLSDIELPVLVLCGEEDHMTTPEMMREMSDKIIHSNFVVVPESGHLSAIENAEFVTNEIRKYLYSIKSDETIPEKKEKKKDKKSKKK